MINLKDLIDSYLNPPICNQSYIEKLKKDVKNDNEAWENRAICSSKSFLKAICFKVVSESMLENKINFIFPPIGFYYSVFHLSLSMLYLERTIDVNQLRNIHHNTLLNLVKSKLIQTKLIDKNYEKWHVELRKLREFCNYSFGYQENLEKLTQKIRKNANCAFDEGVRFNRNILEITDNLFRFQVGIGDGFGDDILDTYISEEDKEDVWSELVQFGMTV